VIGAGTTLHISVSVWDNRTRDDGTFSGADFTFG
jgi:hypothetical protein